MIDASSNALPVLERLEHAVARGFRTHPMARVSGAVAEVSTSHYRVAGF